MALISPGGAATCVRGEHYCRGWVVSCRAEYSFDTSTDNVERGHSRAEYHLRTERASGVHERLRCVHWIDTAVSRSIHGPFGKIPEVWFERRDLAAPNPILAGCQVSIFPEPNRGVAPCQ